MRAVGKNFAAAERSLGRRIPVFDAQRSIHEKADNDGSSLMLLENLPIAGGTQCPRH